MMRFGAKAGNRKPWEELFFFPGVEDAQEKDGQKKAGHYREALEALRLAPSASNKQPWRIVKDPDDTAGPRFHFFLEPTSGYGKIGEGVSLQDIDMGIAMSHFEAASEETGLSGKWVSAEPAAKAIAGELEDTLKEARYIVTWQGR
jgi:nitroreductase